MEIFLSVLATIWVILCILIWLIGIIGVITGETSLGLILAIAESVTLDQYFTSHNPWLFLLMLGWLVLAILITLVEYELDL